MMNVDFAGNGYYTLIDSMTAASVTIDTGVFSTGGNMNIWSTGSWINNNGIFFTNLGTVTFAALTAGQTITSNGSNFYNMTFNSSNGVGYWTLQDPLVALSTITITKGHLGFQRPTDYSWRQLAGYRRRFQNQRSESSHADGGHHGATNPVARVTVRGCFL